MFSTASLTTFLLLVVGVAADSIVVHKSHVKLPITRRLSVTGAHDLVQRDRLRAANLHYIGTRKESGTSSPDTVLDVDVTNLGGVGTYVAQVGVGSPPTNCE